MAGNIATSMISTFMRANNGIQSTPAAEKPEQMLQLYDIENCPYCRLVREALTELDLDAEIYPCPKQGQRFRPQVVERGGKAQFPYLVDLNTGVEMYESLDIVAYLFETYGQRALPIKWRAGRLQTLGSMLASALPPESPASTAARNSSTARRCAGSSSASAIRIYVGVVQF